LQQQLSEVQGYWDDADQPLERVRPDDSTDKNSDLTVDKEALKVRFQSGEEQPNGELLRLQHELLRLQHELQQEREQSSRLKCSNNTFREREAARFLREREAERSSKSSSLRRNSGFSSDGSPVKPYEFDSSPPRQRDSTPDSGLCQNMRDHSERIRRAGGCLDHEAHRAQVVNAGGCVDHSAFEAKLEVERTFIRNDERKRFEILLDKIREELISKELISEGDHIIASLRENGSASPSEDTPIPVLLDNLHRMWTAPDEST
jgi:hypothetical protein